MPRRRTVFLALTSIFVLLLVVGVLTGRHVYHGPTASCAYHWLRFGHHHARQQLVGQAYHGWQILRSCTYGHV